ncbi:hypothetical protein TRVL_05164 [Trypanosoma vivax]|uniref:Uncharacterized protein n=1 Tax=Trypanosoma vivax (strain Y486) TaxID=1055687 RepID=G0TU08_TRYVY|nr:hypothetical protein TRVL_05164 [Trypanosoma vivax]CCC47441.1 conserved hypothetical protein [Trypanosoma vivax Y486]
MVPLISVNMAMLLVAALFCTSVAHAVKPVPDIDIEELVESVLAPFLVVEGGSLYIPRNGQGAPVVCGSESARPSRRVYPATLSHLDEVYSVLQTTEQAKLPERFLDVVEGCYLQREGADAYCVLSLYSETAQCETGIEGSTAYWMSQMNATNFSRDLVKTYANGAAVLVESALHVHRLRERLRLSIRRTREYNEASAELFELASRGWHANDNEEDQKAFREAVSAKGMKQILSTYADVMDKWHIVKQWLKPSVGETSGQHHTLTAANNKSLLSSDAHCYVSTHLDEWLVIANASLYGYELTTFIENEMTAFASGEKDVNGTSLYFSPISHLPCIATSFAVAMLLYDDTPLRLMYQELANDAKNNSEVWPWARFEMLNTSITLAPLYREYVTRHYFVSFEYLLGSPEGIEMLGGNASIGDCAVRAITRSHRRNSGEPPAASLYDCYLQRRIPPLQATAAGNTPLENNTVRAESDKGTELRMCAWGFTRPGGNIWDTREPCSVCPPGSFGDGEGGCRCSEASYPSPTGCKAKMGRSTVAPVWRWLHDADDIAGTAGGEHNPKPILVVDVPHDAGDGDKVNLTIDCTAGLSVFRVKFPPPSNASSGTQGEATLPAQRKISIFSQGPMSLSLSTSVAFGGEQCNFSASIANPAYTDAPTFHVGTRRVVPRVPEVKIHGISLDPPSVGTELVSVKGSNLTCTNGPRGTPGTAQIALCSVQQEELILFIDTLAYTPLTPEMWDILKSSLRVGTSNPEELGELLRQLGKRVRLAFRVEVVRHGQCDVNETVSEGHLLSEDTVHLVITGLSNISKVNVLMGVLDVCAPTGRTVHGNCTGGSSLFVPALTSKVVYTLQNCTALRRTAEGNKQCEKTPGYTTHLTVPHVVLFVVNVVSLAVIGVLSVVYCVFYRRSGEPSVVNEAKNTAEEATSSYDMEEVTKEGNASENASYFSLP